MPDVNTTNKTSKKPPEAAKTVQVALTQKPASLEKLIEAFSGPSESFEDYIRDAATALGGGFLFGLPASGLIDDCQRIAAIQIAEKGQSELKTLFVLLDKSGESLRLRKEDGRLKELESFASAFVDVLQHIGHAADAPATEKQ